MEEVTRWLLDGEPWVQYRTRRDLLKQPESHDGVKEARAAMIEHPQVQSLVKELAEWPGSPLKNHKSAGLLLHKLVFAADLGLRVEDPGMKAAVEKILKHRSGAGPFQVLVNIPTRFGGSGKDEWSWMLCDAPLILYALAKLGLEQDQRVKDGAAYLAGLVRDNGWPCAASPELGKFRGPGSTHETCPYANLVMLKLLSVLPEWHDSREAHSGVEAALTLWEQRRDRHPYLFHMGTDFCKLKAPLIWYDMLHVFDVLSNFRWLREDPRMMELVHIAISKADAEGRFTPESVWMAWRGWDFGQKRRQSRWLTFLVLRALYAVED